MRKDTRSQVDQPASASHESRVLSLRTWLAVEGKTGVEPIGERFRDQAIPDFSCAKAADGNYVASEAVPCGILGGRASPRHITPNTT